MENYIWEIVEDHYLSVKFDGNKIIIPLASEIFSLVYQDTHHIRGLSVSNPSEQINNLKFSKFPLDLHLKLTTQKTFIKVEPIITLNGVELILPKILQHMYDHLIINNTWYPLVEGAIEEVKALLDQQGINDAERITLRQYVGLKSSGHPAILDEIISMPLDKGVYIDETVEAIPGFVGSLYPYQYQGFKWLNMISEQDAGCILADEMGLGKTAQIIALLSSESKRVESPSLVIAPLTLLENWRREVSKFAPTLNILIHQGVHRTGYYADMLSYQVVITSYETVMRDLSLFEMIEWNIVVTDEAQAIKNPGAKRTKALKQLPRRVSIAVTGTPIENRLIDLWSLSDFVFPGFLGDIKEFENRFPEEVMGASSLEPIISPIMLRRRVKDVANDLPERIDIPQVVQLSDGEIDGYERIRQEVVDKYGKNASLVSLIRLRMYCTHPFLQDKESGDPAGYVKYQRMLEILDEVISNREKVLIFTSYTGMTDILVNDLSKRLEIHCDFIDGRVHVSERQTKIDKFSNVDGSAILILNPRAAGAGLNITAANHVIHYNLEWNPAVEDQASARAYRRGQTRPVNVYRLFLADTVEEIINERVERKRLLSDAAVVGTDGSDDYTDIIQALMRSPRKESTD